MVLLPAIIDVGTVRSSLTTDGSTVVVTSNGWETVIDAADVASVAFVREDLPASRMLLASRGSQHVAFVNLTSGDSVRADVTASIGGVRAMIGTFERRCVQAAAR